MSIADFEVGMVIKVPFKETNGVIEEVMATRIKVRFHPNQDLVTLDSKYFFMIKPVKQKTTND